MSFKWFVYFINIDILTAKSKYQKKKSIDPSYEKKKKIKLMIKLQTIRRRLWDKTLLYFLHQQYNVIPLFEQPVLGHVAKRNTFD